MKIPRQPAISRLTLCVLLLLASAAASAAPPEGLSEDEAQEIQRQLDSLAEKVTALRIQAERAEDATALDRLADADIFLKGVVWALRYETKLAPADVALIKQSLTQGLELAEFVAAGNAESAAKPGRRARGYISAIDRSTQPFGLIVPEGYDPQRPIRLDVVLHGSTKPVGLSELRFIDRFEKAGAPPPSLSEQPFIELHPLGRVENCYRWAGETDVFEAIEAVCRRYNIDRDRIVLRGMSMGASGTWHLGLKHPDFFAALGPYCGYVDTHRFSETPLANFIKVGPLPEHQELALHMLDSVDYAANASVVPAIACMGDKDVFFAAHQIMAEAMRKEGLQLVNLISPGTAHVVDPITHREQMRLIGAFASRGVDHAPRKLKFVTWTLKYASCHWLRVLGLKQHYARSELAAALNDDGSIDVEEPQNITAFSLAPPATWSSSQRLRIGGREIARPPRTAESADPILLALRGDRWVVLESSASGSAYNGKRPGLQGPIDDAFTSPFLCVRGTGDAWNPAVQAWADANLRRFAYEWNRYFRGELRIKDDADVTEEDRRQFNLVLFGDPGANALLSEALPKLPIEWTENELHADGRSYTAAEHALALICPSPFSSDPRYLVVNSGHTFHESELGALNYLLFPRLGDWAVFKLGEKQPAEPAAALDEQVLQAGFFDEQWRFRAPAAGQ
jgi:pimeloyl-ACP methyl ester carboxylesterase